MKSTLVVRFTTITYLVFLLFTIVLSAPGSSNSKTEIYLKRFVHGRSIDQDDEQQDFSEDLLEKRFVHS
ncbi:unnamed protein product [Rotaria socialis]|uniref:Uncharacterized protein n=1 Tax=Rotaria socialis TaxID=392032 RepID=A0A818C8N6_9BILA|nr:unnamed protein product [Rotaria socialis]CAF3353825.1 unnamed protein product [Rotaria socialis]CAF3427157.1 unnamed protein product [Rotaria socialis]CAF3445450.1 unnamed protein product [Rotaria socialis]CAF3540024.1 unnamed protein product [Rotaria socialis]